MARASNSFTSLCYSPFAHLRSTIGQDPNMTPTGCLKCTCISCTGNSTAPLTITLGIQADPRSVASPLTCPLAAMQASSCPLVFTHWSLTQDLCGLIYRYVSSSPRVFIRFDMGAANQVAQDCPGLIAKDSLSWETLQSGTNQEIWSQYERYPYTPLGSKDLVL